MISVHFYDMSTGVIRPKSFKTTSMDAAKIIELNTPHGHKPIYGVSDPRCQRVDVATGEIVACEPRRDKYREIAAARSRIADLEIKQARRVRELLLESDPQLQAIDVEIGKLRKVINETDTTSREG